MGGAISAKAQVTTIDYSGAIDSYTVPVGVTAIRIEARGAQGANDGGFGAIMIGDFIVTPGEELTVLVGGEGTAASSTRAGGGGGTFVVNSSDEPLIIAGGGGGKAWNGVGSPTFPGIDANTTTNGNDGYSLENALGTTFDERFGLGGVDGEGGGGAGPDGEPHAGNGGGLLTDGEDGTCGFGGDSFLSGGAGGTGCSGGPGGFGGGGNGGNSGGGGGGGYSGGGGSYHNPTNGGGGGSYNDGTDQDNSVGNLGNGQVIITVLCSPLTVDVSATEICLGESLTVEAVSELGGSVTWTDGIVNGEPFTPEAPGVYTYTATSDEDGDCIFEVEVEVFDAPEVVAEVDQTLICEGDSVLFTVSGDADSYEWDPDVIVDGTYYTPPVGTETYTLTGTLDGTGCSADSSVMVEVVEALSLSVTATDEMMGGDGSIDLTVTGGLPTYYYDWDNDGTGDFDDTEDLTDLTAGTYTVVVEDSAGCTGEIEVIINSQVSIDEEMSILEVYPNPTTGEVRLSVEGNFEYQLFSLNGNVLLSGKGNQQVLLDLATLSDGVYILKVMTEENSFKTRVVKKQHSLKVDG